MGILRIRLIAEKLKIWKPNEHWALATIKSRKLERGRTNVSFLIEKVMVLHHKPICQRNDMYAICHKSVFLQAGCIYHKTNKSLFWYKKVVPVEHLVMLVYLIPSLHPTAKSLVIFFVYPITPNLSYLACQYLVISLDRLLDRYNITRQNYTPQNFRA